MAPLHPHRAFWLIAATYMMVLFASAAPSPLYPVYQELWGFSALTLTLVFAVYVLTMLLSLLTVGSLSDHVGRRPVLAVALVLLIASMVLFVVAQDVGTLLAARALQGLATGAAMGTLTATTVDLQPSARIGSTIVGAAPAIGLASGVAVAGVLVEYAPAPRVLIYEIILGLFAALLIALLIVPETRERIGFDSRRHLAGTLAPQVRVPREVRTVFLASVPALVATWSLGGLYLSLGSSVVSRVFGVDNHGAAGAILFVFFACAALTSLFITDRPSTIKAAYGLPALAAGVVISLAGVLAESLPLYIVGSIVAGSGWAATFLSAMDNITAATPPAQRGQVFSSVFVASYLAFSVPAVIAGIVVSHIGLRDTIIGYVGYVLAMVMIAATFAVTMHRRATTAVRDSVEDAAAHPEPARKG
ncbi:MFS transporter [Gordonia terrae]|uniref:MFS transporter n=2 Tax=Gordonia terrae TaxID=2055 RepID=A0AAD0K6P8_9ACTN|nr:MFS transporter [Gordonia terrae]VTR09346.1 major facilitator superfamily protein [Clostridioides difficile]ANY21999.1 MFS transporter [Gordonia terrae]AWO82738.1 MFS transporter [Gordonia terrae]VTS25377.1 Inner membrane transport protein ynfM [Gordonia terrae]GAB45958.1 putative major facilitator superfamily transporter [Gordonia terrae NBRC 100016]